MATPASPTTTSGVATAVPRPPAVVIAIALSWLGIATLIVATGWLAAWRPPLPQVLLVSLTAMLLIAARTTTAFRSWLLVLPVRRVLQFHLVRFVGYAFLWLSVTGAMPTAFAVPAGIGDIVVATAALLLLSVATSPRWNRLVLVWNIVGLADILFVVATAARLAMADPASMLALMRFPLGLLPTFIVPLVIASHLWVFAALRSSRQHGSA